MMPYGYLFASPVLICPSPTSARLAVQFTENSGWIPIDARIHAGWCFAIPHAASGGGTSLARLIPLQLY